MRLADFCIFFTLCLFQVKSDLITDFGKTVNEAVKKVVNNEQEFADSVIQMLSNLKDLSMDMNSKALQATLDQANFVTEKAKIDQTACINSKKDEFGEKIVKMSFDLDSCVQEPRKIGNEIREKLQTAHEKTLKMQEDMKEISTSCSSKITKLDECISQKISDAQKDLNNLLEAVQIDSIAGETIKSKILSESLKCSAKVSSEMFQIANEFQGFFKNCIA
ncbi:uncharacterized protein LOC122500922 isoform X2 [Leptopilina heterotoma]|uniref:uncharacterized protein LOC122500922 isoform X2 n=1 Tax=Leptopilina heterotoma TaxID=63436 RepID=UPI001CA9C698|nr:uncharacterized protein LOC122500922 isoform X2 [Leptopilina heterotoma]